MRKIIWILFPAFVILVFCRFVLFEKKIVIYLEEYDYFFTPQKPDCIDTISGKLKDGRAIKIFLSNCMGEMRVECYKGTKKTEEGNYISSLDLLKIYRRGVNAVTGKQAITVSEYYQPLRTGQWLFYDQNGKLLKKRTYIRGITENK